MRSAAPEPVRDPLPGALFFRAIRRAPLLARLRRRPRLAGRRAFRRRLVLHIVADHALDRASRENRTLLATDGKGDGAERHAASPGYGAGIVVPGSEGSCPASQSWPRRIGSRAPKRTPLYGRRHVDPVQADGGACGLHTPGARRHHPPPARSRQRRGRAVSAGAWGMKPEDTALPRTRYTLTAMRRDSP